MPRLVDDLTFYDGTVQSSAATFKNVVSGRVTSAGGVGDGSGFSVTKLGTGAYIVNFTTAYADVPNVQVSGYGNSDLQVDVISAGTSAFQVSTTASSTGTAVDAAFTFRAEPYTSLSVAGPGYTRTTKDHTTGSVVNGATENSTFTVNPGWRAYKASTTALARIRIYGTSAQRTADASRAVGVDPTGSHGLLLELVINGMQVLSPIVDLMSDDGSSTYYMAVTNMSGGTATIVTTYYYARTE